MAHLKLLGDSSPWLHDAVSDIMATFSGEDASFYPLAMLLIDLDRQAREGNGPAAEVLACVRQFARLINLAKRI